MHHPTEGTETHERRIDRADQLPSRSYAVGVTGTAILDDEDALVALVRRVRQDLDQELETFDFADRSVAKGHHTTLAQIAMLEGRDDTALRHLEHAAGFEGKPGPRLLSGLLERAILDARGGDRPSFREALDVRLRALPYGVVSSDLRGARAGCQVATDAIVRADLSNHLGGARSALDRDAAGRVIAAAHWLRLVGPVREAAVEVIGRLLSENAVEKADIWRDRDVALGPEGSRDVVVGVWDTGVDPSCFSGRMVSGGPAFDLDAEPDPRPLMPLALRAVEEAALLGYAKGWSDLTAGLDSTEAQDLQRHIAGLDEATAAPFLEDLIQHGYFAHGTHVAGIAVRGNPAARIASVRMTFDYRSVPARPTVAWAERLASAFHDSVGWYRTVGAGVVTMSWVFTPGVFEAALAAHEPDAPADDRRSEAGRIFDILEESLEAALRSAPDILFVAGAGNADEDNRFSRSVPAAFRLPNLLTVGAVDRAGDEAPFTSYGGVDLYANGSEVESLVPGGEVLRLSGTSMAAPQVANTAGKLAAVAPDLDAAALRRLILEGADEREIDGRRIRLLHPARSLELAGRGSPATSCR